MMPQPRTPRSKVRRKRAEKYFDKEKAVRTTSLRHHSREDYGDRIVSHLSATLQLSHYMYDRVSHIRDTNGCTFDITQILTTISNIQAQLKKYHEGIQPIWTQAKRHRDTLSNDKDWAMLKASLIKIQKTTIQFEESLRTFEKQLP